MKETKDAWDRFMAAALASIAPGTVHGDFDGQTFAQRVAERAAKIADAAMAERVMRFGVEGVSGPPMLPNGTGPIESTGTLHPHLRDGGKL
jgi:hypothetical protein